VVLVTGASRGIGAALASALAAERANLALISREGEAARRIAVELKRECGIEAVGRACDIRNARQVEAVIADIVKRLGRLDVAINNAGVLGALAPIAEYDPAVWRSTIETNVNGTFHVTRFVSEWMARKGGGRIVFVSSSVGREARAGWGAYAVSKHAIEWIMRIVADEASQSKVLACSINPGATATDMRRQAFPDEDQTKLPSPDQMARAFLRIMRKPDAQFNGHVFNAQDFL
jgi:NAD(P)-dependent dehydrogenase (short-subunit alcohol dehydrogenase family)